MIDDPSTVFRYKLLIGQAKGCEASVNYMGGFNMKSHEREVSKHGYVWPKLSVNGNY